MRLRPVLALVVAASALAAAAATADARTLRVPSDDYLTIQSAVDDALPGDLIVVGPGTYDEEVMIQARQDLKVFGRGGPVITGGTGPASIVVLGSQDIRLAGFRIESQQAGVFVNNSQRVRVERITVIAPQGVGLQVNGCDDVWVKRCAVEDSIAAGISVQDPAGVRVERCTVLNAGFQGILALGQPAVRGTFGYAARVAKNSLADSSQASVDATGAGMIVEKNRITGPFQQGIRADSPPAGGVVVQKNRIEAAGGEAISVQGTEVLVAKNQVLGASTGIVLSGQGAHSAQRNRLLGILGDGILVASAGNALERNQVRDAGGNGYLLQADSNTLLLNLGTGSGGFDLQSDVPESVNTFDRNRFGTTSFPPP